MEDWERFMGCYGLIYLFSAFRNIFFFPVALLFINATTLVCLSHICGLPHDSIFTTNCHFHRYHTFMYNNAHCCTIQISSHCHILLAYNENSNERKICRSARSCLLSPFF